MPTKKTPPRGIPTRFRLPVDVGAEQVAVVGEFNGWSATANPMQVEGDEFVADVDLEPGRAYRYRFLLDGERWENAWNADAYVPNEFGADDCVIDLRDAQAPAATPTRPRKAAAGAKKGRTAGP